MDKKKKNTNKRVNKVNNKNTKIKFDINKKIGKYSIIDWILLGIFIALVITVIVLGFKIHNKKNELKKDPKADFSIPILEAGSTYEFMIDAIELKNKDDYVLKITNVKGNQKAKNDVKFTIEITNDTGSLLQMMKNKNAKNLLSNEVTSVVEDTLKLKDGNIYYHLKMPSSSKVKDDDKIKFKINS